MSREWNPAHFFRQTTHQVVSEFAKALEVPPPRSGCPPFVWWRELSAADRARVDPHLFAVNELCCEKGRDYLEAAAREAWATDERKLARVLRSSSPDLGLLLKVELAPGLATAMQSFAIDSMECQTEYAGKRAIAVTPTGPMRNRLRAALARRFRESCGSDRCVIDEHRDDERLAMFVWHETVAIPGERFDERGELVTQLRRDVASMAAIYDQTTGMLLVKAPRDTHRQMIRQLFGEVLFDDVDFFQTPSTPRFQFEVLGRHGFVLPPSPHHGIARVGVARITLSPASRHMNEVSLHFEPPVPVETVREQALCHQFDLQLVDITEVTLKVTLSKNGASRTRTVHLRSPNTSNLNESQSDRSIREYLAEVGLYAYPSSVAVSDLPTDPL